MKLLIIILLLCSSITLSAQVQNVFFGFELGCNINDVYDAIKSKYETKTFDEGFLAKNVKFGGYVWDKVVFYQYKIQFYKIFLSKKYESKNKIKEDYNNVLNIISNKNLDGVLHKKDKTNNFNDIFIGNKTTCKIFIDEIKYIPIVQVVGEETNDEIEYTMNIIYSENSINRTKEEDEINEF